MAGSLFAEDPVPRTTPQLKALAERYEKDGLKAEAAGVYEELIRAEPEARTVAAPRLVQLYVETRQPAKALEWAREVIKTNPDPRAYLAAVYTRLGGYNEARAILEKELAAESEAGRKITLLWQLAEANELEDRMDEAEENLRAAAETARGTPHDAQAQKKLDGFRLKHQPASGSGSDRGP